MEEQFERLITAINATNAPTFLDWAPIILSLISVAIAMYIPWMIAKKQNQIAVFDKLYNAYSKLLLIKSFATDINGYSFSHSKEDIYLMRKMFFLNFGMSFDYVPNIDNSVNDIGNTITAIRMNEVQACMIPMLMAEDVEAKEKYSKKILSIYDSLIALTACMLLNDTNSLEKAKEAEKELASFVAHITDFFNTYSDGIEKKLCIGSCKNKRHH